jgi:hypothetical protein
MTSSPIDANARDVTMQKNSKENLLFNKKYAAKSKDNVGLIVLIPRRNPARILLFFFARTITQTSRATTIVEILPRYSENVIPKISEQTSKQHILRDVNL